MLNDQVPKILVAIEITMCSRQRLSAEPSPLLKVCLHQASASTLRQLCDDTSNSVLIENNGVALEWSYKPFSSDSIVFIENSIASIIAALTLTLGVNGP